MNASARELPASGLAAGGAPVPGARLGRAALACGIGAQLLQPMALLIAVFGGPGNATTGGIVLVLSLSTLLSFAALIGGITSRARLRRTPSHPRTAPTLAIVAALLGLLGALGFGALALLIASGS